MERFSVALQWVCHLMFDANMSVHGVSPLKSPAQDVKALSKDDGVVPPR